MMVHKITHSRIRHDRPPVTLTVTESLFGGGAVITLGTEDGSELQSITLGPYEVRELREVLQTYETRKR